MSESLIIVKTDRGRALQNTNGRDLLVITKETHGSLKADTYSVRSPNDSKAVIAMQGGHVWYREMKLARDQWLYQKGSHLKVKLYFAHNSVEYVFKSKHFGWDARLYMTVREGKDVPLAVFHRMLGYCTDSLSGNVTFTSDGQDLLLCGGQATELLAVSFMAVHRYLKSAYWRRRMYGKGAGGS